MKDTKNKLTIPLSIRVLCFRVENDIL